MQMLLIVIVVAFLIVLAAKAVFRYPSYKNSIYRSLYSMYLEYFYRYEIRQDCSKSSWLQNQIGTHRMYFSEMMDQDGKAMGHFVTFIYHKGIVVVSFLNPNGTLIGKAKDKFWVVKRTEDEQNKSFRISNPTVTLDQYVSRITDTLGKSPTQTVIAVHDNTDFSQLKGMNHLISYKQLVDYLKELQTNTTLEDNEIQELFKKLKG